MNYLAWLFLSHLSSVSEETRFVDGEEQVCLIIPSKTNQLKRGKRGNWILPVRLRECPPNAKNASHKVELQYLSKDSANKARMRGTYEQTQRMGNVYIIVDAPEKKIDRRNPGSDVRFDGIIILSDIPKSKINTNKQNGKRYVSNITFCPDEGSSYTGFLCMDDIPSAKIQTNLYTGKKYVECRFVKCECLDIYMNTHQLAVVMDDGSLIEIGRFKEWQKTGEHQNSVASIQPEEIHNTGVNQRQAPLEIDGLKF